MSAILDLLVIIILIGFVVSSTKQGFVKSVMGFVGYIASFFIAKAYSASLGQMLSEKYITPFLSNKAAEQIGSITNSTGGADAVIQSADIPKLISDAPDAFQIMLSTYGSSIEAIKQTVSDSVSNKAEQVNKYIIDTIVSGAAKIISDSLAFILIFVSCIIAIKLLIIVLDSLFKLPILSTFNSLGGFAIGILKGGLIAVAIASIITAISPFISYDSKPFISEQSISNTIVFKHLNFSKIVSTLTFKN